MATVPKPPGFSVRILPGSERHPLTSAILRYASTADIAPNTAREYRTAANKWQTFVESRSGLNSDSPGGVAEPGRQLATSRPGGGHRSTRPMGVTPPELAYPPTLQDLTDFQSFLVKTHEGENPPSVTNKRLRSLKTVLRAESRATDPPFKVPEFPATLKVSRVADKLYIPHDHVGRLYHACDGIGWPDAGPRRQRLHFSAAAYWRCLLVLSFNYGFDVQQMARFSPSITHHLKWKNVCWSRPYPGDDADVASECGWLWIIRQKTARKRPAPIIFPMNEAVRNHLMAIAPPGSIGSDLSGGKFSERSIFPWPHNRKRFSRAWRKLCELAGVQPKPTLAGAERKYKHKHFRNTSATYHNLHCKGSASLILGHARGVGETITSKHYDNTAMALVEAMRLPQPDSFSRLGIDSSRIRRFLLGDDDPQGWLFR